MSRFFIEVSYKGARYGGFQIQQNTNTIQQEVQSALRIYFRNEFELTGSSRTDAGVHANQNYFHFDNGEIDEAQFTEASYHLNAILPNDVVVKKIFKVLDESHCRFDAISRSYGYVVYQQKNPFLEDRGYYFPYPLNLELMNSAAELLLDNTDFEAFSKKNTQVNNFKCFIKESRWENKDGLIKYSVTGNRFLRGMVRGLVGTMLRVGTGKTDLEGFLAILKGRDPSKVDFSVPGHGLFLEKVLFDQAITG
jgi:tRNA pseudouridine38-40 synthase